MTATREDYLNNRYFQLESGPHGYILNYHHRYLQAILGVSVATRGRSRSEAAQDLMMARKSLRFQAKHVAWRIFPAAEYIHVDIVLE